MTNLVDDIMGYQLFCGCWRGCNGTNRAARRVSLPHCTADANVKETVSVRSVQGSALTYRESCPGTCQGFSIAG